MGKVTNAFTILGGNPRNMRLFWRSTFRLEDNIKLYPKVIGFKGVDWIRVAQYRIQ
jgi:hypothetical protein